MIHIQHHHHHHRLFPMFQCYLHNYRQPTMYLHHYQQLMYTYYNLQAL